jgi:prophage DNA circulation protein
MAAFDRLPLASFSGYQFPVKLVSIKGALRHHVHEYPHAPGGSTEGLGRKLYEIKMSAPMHEGFARWPKLWPETLGTLRTLFEGGEPWELTIPTIGTISARCIQWEQQMSAKARSGEDCEFTFLEEQQDAFLVDKLITNSTDLVPLSAKLDELAAARDTRRLGIADQAVLQTVLATENAKFAKVSTLVAEVGSFDRNVEQYGALAATKARSAAKTCRDLYENARSLKDPANWELVAALQEVEVELVKLTKDALGTRRETRTHVVRKLASIGQVSTEIYGRTDRAQELLQLNDFDNVLAIAAGTRILYYAEAA